MLVARLLGRHLGRCHCFTRLTKRALQLCAGLRECPQVICDTGVTKTVGLELGFKDRGALCDRLLRRCESLLEGVEERDQPDLVRNCHLQRDDRLFAMVASFGGLLSDATLSGQLAF